jgi:hypothetical protein
MSLPIGFLADVACLLIKGNNVDSTNMNTVFHCNQRTPTVLSLKGICNLQRTF